VIVNDLAASGEYTSPAVRVAQEIEAAGGSAAACEGTVSEFAAAEIVMKTAKERFGRLDILVANAGNTRPALVHEASEADWSDVLAVHANGTFNSVRTAAPLLIESGGGSIITVGDLTTDLYFPGLAAYRAAKAAIAVLTLYAAKELSPFNINVNAIMPGATDTVMMRAFFASLGDHQDEFIRDVKKRYESEGTGEAPPASPDSVPALGTYLCTTEGRSITGRLFSLKQNSVRLFTPHGEIATISPDEDEPWTLDSLGEALPDWIAGLGATVA
jgi:NAD(P)-dependent dehydrogenase (short-subunit alcohol dehydrogenase family)